MLEPPVPLDEHERVETLRDLGILDTPPEERFDRVTRLARALFDVPIALVTLVDSNRQWFKSRQGLATAETFRAMSFCGHAILRPETLVVPDARLDPRFADNPLVTGPPYVRFYAGRPLGMPNGHRVGTLCLIDREPRTLDECARERLDDLAAVVEELLAAMELVTTDPATGVSNLRGFSHTAAAALAVATRNRQQTALIRFQLPAVRDADAAPDDPTSDRTAGDFAASMKRVFRQSDVLGRRSRGSFCALLTAVGPPVLPNLVERLRRDLMQAGKRAGERSITFDYGSAFRGRDEKFTVEELVRRADGDLMRRARKPGARADAARDHGAPDRYANR